MRSRFPTFAAPAGSVAAVQAPIGGRPSRPPEFSIGVDRTSGRPRIAGGADPIRRG